MRQESSRPDIAAECRSNPAAVGLPAVSPDIVPRTSLDRLAFATSVQALYASSGFLQPQIALALLLPPAASGPMSRIRPTLLQQATFLVVAAAPLQPRSRR